MKRKNVTVSVMGYDVRVQRDAAWQECRVTIKAGRAVLSSYHTDDYADARSTAAWEIRKLRAKAQALNAVSRNPGCKIVWSSPTRWTQEVK